MWKRTRPFRIFLPLVGSLLLVVSINRGMGQAYSFSAPISGRSDVALSFGTGSIGSGYTVFGILNETLYYDPTAQTLRQVGSVTLSPVSDAFSIWCQSAYPDLPNPPTGTANLTIGDGSGTLSFDTGVQNLSSYWELSIPVNGSCTVVYNGQTNSGPVNYSVNLTLSTQILSADPSSLVLSEGYDGFDDDETYVATIGGWELYDGTDDGTYHYSWNLNSVTATAVPEPDASMLLWLAVPLLVFFRRRWP
jgi:hypothetical protein